MKKIIANNLTPIILFIFCILFFSKDLAVHGLEYRDDEVFYVQSTKEMLNSHNYLSPTFFGENRFQKPILYYWLILISYQFWGIDWFAARWVSVFLGSLTVLLTWFMAKKLFNGKVALLSCFILITTFMFYRHAKNAVPDMPLNFFIVLACYSGLWFSYHPSSRLFRSAFFIAMALGFLVKGFTAILIPGLTFAFYFFMTHKKDLVKRINFPLEIFIMLLIILPWFIYMILLHGKEYWNYMIVAETQQRILDQAQGPVVIKFIKSFLLNIIFYIKVIFSYYAPWCVFFVLAVPVAISKIKSRQKEAEPLMFLLIWIAVVFVFFSMIATRINHYMLALSTPFAILLSFNFYETFQSGSVNSQRMIMRIQKYGIYLILLMIFTVWGLFSVFFLNFPALGGLVAFGAMGLASVIMLRNKNPMLVPLTLSIVLIVIYGNLNLFNRVGFTSHPVLQRFANTVQEELSDSDAIIVGSHDIHEKEFQIYFNQKVVKLATDEFPETWDHLYEFLTANGKTYCLITAQDYKKLLQDQGYFKFDIIRKELMFRKRFSLDQGFLQALLRFDRPAVHQYLLEEVYLVVRKSQA